MPRLRSSVVSSLSGCRRCATTVRLRLVAPSEGKYCSRVLLVSISEEIKGIGGWLHVKSPYSLLCFGLWPCMRSMLSGLGAYMLSSTGSTPFRQPLCAELHCPDRVAASEPNLAIRSILQQALLDDSSQTLTLCPTFIFSCSVHCNARRSAPKTVRESGHPVSHYHLAGWSLTRLALHHLAPLLPASG